MSHQKRVFILIGSLRGSKSTSDFLGSLLSEALINKGFSAEKLYVSDLFKNRGVIQRLLSSIDNADAVVFSAPLYIDSQPYLMVKTMESIQEHARNNGVFKGKCFCVISNGGYPEAKHNETVMRIYQNFGSSVGFKWLGGLAMGMGASITVPVIRKFDFLISKIKKSIATTADAIANEQSIPPEAIKEISVPMMPIWLYSFLARSIARIFSLTNGAWNICTRPTRTDSLGAN